MHALARALAAADSCSARSLELVLVGLVGGALGCWIVLYELSYSAESLAHALFPGLVVAALLGLPLLARRGGSALARRRASRSRSPRGCPASAATPRSRS